MKYQLPLSIENCIGEKLTFLEHLPGIPEDKLLVENFVRPGVGPLMHTHFFQDEALTVVSGKIGYEVKGEAAKYAGAGETVLFKRGTPHRFWNAGEAELHCKGFIQPANSVVFFLSSIFAAQNKSGSARPALFDGAFLITRYSSEYRVDGMPWLVRKVVLPIVYFIGITLGKYKHFKKAPSAIKK